MRSYKRKIIVLASAFLGAGAFALTPWSMKETLINADKVNQSIQRAMDPRETPQVRAGGLTVLTDMCRGNPLLMRIFCVEEIWDTSVFLQNRSEPTLVRKEARKLYMSLQDAFPDKLRCVEMPFASL
jgi:hypothetical protein